eukprot:TRINITY_DN3750_c0_g2_i2.p1 TRINITY_DN3750_c0_g2~~TRINITY_DN3750_c0_g2_i2.p1  ORF type:complete len:191 (+),score=27.46 TRINITY_DN3750_c0_g2_i2:34-606(+)
MELLSDSDEWRKHCFRMRHLDLSDRTLHEKLSNVGPNWLIAHSITGIRNGKFESIPYPDDYAVLSFRANWDLIGLSGKTINFNIKVDVYGSHCQDRTYAECNFEHNNNNNALFSYEYDIIDYVKEMGGDEDGYLALVSLMSKRKEDLDLLPPSVVKNYINTIILMNETSNQGWVLYKNMIHTQWPSFYHS